MKYLLHCDLSDHNYSVDYTLIGIFDSKEECIRYMKEYNKKVEEFNERSADLIAKAAYEPANDPKYKTFTYMMEEPNFDPNKLAKAPEVEKEVNELYARQEEYRNQLAELKYEADVLQEDGSEEMFKFDLDNIEDYIDVFDGKPLCLTSYSE